MVPPDALVVEWEGDWHNSGPECQDYAAFMATRAARWGADQQLKLDAAQVSRAYQKGHDSARYDDTQFINEKTSMTEQHPIVPSAELVAKLWKQATADRDDAPIGEIFNHGVSLAYAAGADMEFEACQDWVAENISTPEAEELRYARRPKQPSRKERALEALGRKPGRDHVIMIDDARYNTILSALEALDD